MICLLSIQMKCQDLFSLNIINYLSSSLVVNDTLSVKQIVIFILGYCGGIKQIVSYSPFQGIKHIVIYGTTCSRGSRHIYHVSVN